MFRSVSGSKPLLCKLSFSTPSRSGSRPSRLSLSTSFLAVAAAFVLGALPPATDAVAAAYYDDGGDVRAPRTHRRGFLGRPRGDVFRPRPPRIAVPRDPMFRGGYPEEDAYPPPRRFPGPRGPVVRGGDPDGAYPRPFARRVYRNGRYEYVYYGCERWRWAATPWGWRWRRVNVCYPSSYY